MTLQDLARASVRDRSDFVTVAATELGLSELIVEKDFWVVWLLERLFALSSELGPFTFKGGTSLSKGFQLIERFSEDIDISISRSALGFPDDGYFYEAPSRAELTRRIEAIRERVRRYVSDTIRPRLHAEIEQGIGESQWDLADADPGALRFRYPTRQRGAIGYVKPDVLIEFGHADPWPALDVALRPYIGNAIAALTGTVQAHLLDPRRTFWEKVTALHEVARRPDTVRFPDRFSRHYYDVAVIADTEIGTQAIADTELLDKVARFKATFFFSARARYDLAKPGTISIMFPEFRRHEVQRDYAHMRPMLFGAVPTFEEICDRLTRLENQLNDHT